MSASPLGPSNTVRMTLRQGTSESPASVSATMAGLGGSDPIRPIDLDQEGALDATMAALPAESAAVPVASPARASAAGSLAGRVAVLPRRRKPDSPGMQARYDRVKVLGQGGMGEVALVRDNDIRRTVAVKYLRADRAGSMGALLRFADEVRVVGQLEHPAIVPVYDVGIDDAGQHFLVMKHLQGSTMEEVIEKLRAGDPETVARFTPEYRATLFLQILDAIRYAHARGVIHRDLKPANVMIGPYGEVTVMDWGIAKPLGRKTSEATTAKPLEPGKTGDARLLETRHGELAGTPLYMSPEQAAGKNDDLDERSDVYALSVLLYEWIVLEHPLHDLGLTTVSEVLAHIIAKDYDDKALVTRAMKAGVPCEYIFLAVKGLKRKPSERLASVTELEEGLRNIGNGKISVACHITLAKRASREVVHWIDRHPVAYSVMFFGTILTLLAGVVGAAIFGLRHLH